MALTNFLSEAISNEAYKSIKPWSLEDEVELTQTMADADQAEQEIEVLEEQRQRAEATAQELETQNAAVRGIVEANGELTESEAALVEAGRRQAAVALGLDPDSEAGQDVVDQQGLEAMVTHRGLIALEKSEGMVAKVWNAIKAFFAKIMNGIKAFMKFLSKATNKLEGRNKEAYEKLKTMSDDDYNANIKNNGVLVQYLGEDGKPLDFDDKIKAIRKVIGEVDPLMTRQGKNIENATGPDYPDAFADYKSPVISLARNTYQLVGENKTLKYIRNNLKIENNKIDVEKKDLMNSFNTGLILLKYAEEVLKICEKKTAASEKHVKDIEAKIEEGSDSHFIQACKLYQNTCLNYYKFASSAINECFKTLKRYQDIVLGKEKKQKEDNQ